MVSYRYVSHVTRERDHGMTHGKESGKVTRIASEIAVGVEQWANYTTSIHNHQQYGYGNQQLMLWLCIESLLMVL